MWKRLKKDFKERFVKFETLRGLILLPAGLILVVTTWTHFQYSLQVFMTSIGLYWSLDGFRKIFVNRVKQHIRLQKEVKAATAANVVK